MAQSRDSERKLLDFLDRQAFEPAALHACGRGDLDQLGQIAGGYRHRS